MLIVSRDPRWFVVMVAIVIIGREIAVSALREWMAEIGARGRIGVSVWGKYKTIDADRGAVVAAVPQDLLGIPIYKLGLMLTGGRGRADAVVDVPVPPGRLAGAAGSARS